MRLCRLSMSFQECPHQKLFFDLNDKKYKKAKMKGGLGWRKNIGNDPRSLFNGNHFCSSFHNGYYSKFTDRVKGNCSDASVVDASVTITRSVVSLPLAVTSSSGVLEKNCIFCKGPVHKYFQSI